MFDDVVKREGGKRAAHRSAWLAGSTAMQAAVVAGVVFVSSTIAKKVVEGPVVDVKFVKALPPAPPPPPPAPRRKVPPHPKAVVTRPRPAMIQPKEVPAELKPPDKSEPEEEDLGEGVEGGVIGGVVGGLSSSGAGSVAAPPAGPVEFQSGMTPPALISGPPLEYTQQALDREVEGIMQVKCIVAVDGSVHNCQVVRSLPFMDRQVVTVLERRRYKPATEGGRPLSVAYVFTIKLQLPR